MSDVRAEERNVAVLIEYCFVSFVSRSAVRHAVQVAVDRPRIELLIAGTHWAGLRMTVSKRPVLDLAEAERSQVNVAHSRLRSVCVAGLHGGAANRVVVALDGVVDDEAAAVEHAGRVAIGADEEWLGIGVANACDLAECGPPSSGGGRRVYGRLAVGADESVEVVGDVGRSLVDCRVGG